MKHSATTGVTDAESLRQSVGDVAAERMLRDLLENAAPVFLLGAGCSKAVGLPLIGELTELVLCDDQLEEGSREILEATLEVFRQQTNANEGHIEDFLSELVDLLAIADRRALREAKRSSIDIGNASYSPIQIRKGIDEIKESIARYVNKEQPLERLSTHRAFVRSVHTPVRQGRRNPGLPVSYLILNYDTLLEDALGVEKIGYSDGMTGGATGWWSPDEFRRADLEARVFKLHGSVDWREFEGDLLPRRLSPNVQGNSEDAGPVVIWPASTKYRETRVDPFAQLSEVAWASVRPTRGVPTALMVCGYSFGDAHINEAITSVLREARGELTLVIFTSEPEPLQNDQLRLWYQDDELKENVMMFAKRGFFHGDVAWKSTEELDWWKFEKTVQILQG